MIIKSSVFPSMSIKHMSDITVVTLFRINCALIRHVFRAGDEELYADVVVVAALLILSL